MNPTTHQTNQRTTQKTSGPGSWSDYPWFAKPSLARIFKTVDLYAAIGTFMVFQIATVGIAIGSQNPSDKTAGAIIAIIAGLTAISIAGLAIRRQRRRYPTATYESFKITHVIATVLTMLATLFTVTVIYTKLGVTMPEQVNQTSLNDLQAHYPVLMALIIIIVAPIVEETVFRELIPDLLGGSKLGYLIGSLCFIMLHSPAGLMGWTSYGILSAGFLFAKVKGNNIYMAIAAHVLWNAMSVFL